MKKLLHGFILVFGMAVSAQANTWNVQANLFTLGLESALTENLSVAGFGHYSATSALYSVGVSSEVNYYFSGVYEDSFYVGAYGRYYSVNGTSDYNSTTYDVTGNIVNIGALVGYRWMWEQFNINLDFGYGYGGGTSVDKQVELLKKAFSSSALNVSEENIRTLFSFYGSLTLGWAF